MNTIFKTTDEVYDYEHGKGRILQFAEDTIIVVFEKHRYNRTFSTQDAKLRLSFTPYDLVNGGFSQERPKPEIDWETIDKMYEQSFPRHNEAWKALCASRKLIGWKDFYFMVLKMQKETSEDSNYKLNSSH